MRPEEFAPARAAAVELSDRDLEHVAAGKVSYGVGPGWDWGGPGWGLPQRRCRQCNSRDRGEKAVHDILHLVTVDIGAFATENARRSVQ